MLFVASANLIALLIAALIGLVTAFWTFRVRNSPSAGLPDERKAGSKETPLP